MKFKVFRAIFPVIFFLAFLSSFALSEQAHQKNYDMPIVTTCQALNQPNTVYTQGANIIALGSGACINIVAPNITFDGNGFSITGAEAGLAGIYSNQSGTKIKNVNIKNFTGFAGGKGIFFNGASNSLITNAIVAKNIRGIFINNSALITIANSTADSNSIEGINFRSTSLSQVTNNILSSNGDFGILLLLSQSNQIKDNLIYSSQYGLYLDTNANNNTVSGNLVKDNINGGISLSYNKANKILNNDVINSGITSISIYNSSSNLLADNLIKGGNYGIIFSFDSSHNKIANTIIDSANYSIAIFSSVNNSFDFLTLNNSNGDAIYLYLAHGTIFNNAAVTNTKTPYLDLILDSSVNNLYLINTFLNKYSFASPGSAISVRNTKYGEIKFLQHVSGQGPSLANEISFGPDRAIIDSSSNPGLNRSAKITIIPYSYDADSYMVFRNKQKCPPTICSNNTNTNEGVVFTVTIEGNYSLVQL